MYRFERGLFPAQRVLTDIHSKAYARTNNRRQVEKKMSGQIGTSI